MLLLQLLEERFPQFPEKIAYYNDKYSDHQKDLLLKVIEAHKRAEESGKIESLVVATAHQHGGNNALREILREMGPKKDFKDESREIQEIVRRYLGDCGFKRANELLVSNTGSEPEAFDDPDASPEAYHQVALSLIALSQLLESVASKQDTALSDEECFGGFIFCLLVRNGALSLAETRRTIIEIQAGRLANIDQYWYTHGPLGKGGQQTRRLLLTPLTLAFLARCHRSQLVGEINSSQLNAGLNALAKRLQAYEAITWRSFKGLQTFAIRFLRLQPEMTQHVVDYMSDALSSTSLAESCWAGLFGFKADPIMLIHEQESKSLRKRAFEKPKVIRPGFIQEICKSLGNSSQRAARRNTLSLLEPVCEGLIPKPKLIKQLAEFVVWMLSINGLETSTSKMHLENLSQVLFPMVSSLEQEIVSADQWEAMIENMLRDETIYSKSINAVTKFAEYLTRRYGNNFNSAGYSAAALVNANILTKEQKDQAVGRIRLKLEAKEKILADVACDLVELAYGLGARRWELLGLHFEDVLGELEPLIRFVRNATRDLKTDASTRQLSMMHLKDEPFFSQWKEFTKRKSEEDADSNILKVRDFDLDKFEGQMFKAIADSLKEVTGLEDVSFHTLRHTAACRFLLSLYWPSIDLGDFERHGYFAQIASEGELIREAMLRKNTQGFLEHKTVSAFLGHLSYKTTAAHYFHFYCLLRYGSMQVVNAVSPLQDTPRLINAITGIQKQVADEVPVKELINQFVAHFQLPVIRVDQPLGQRNQLVLSTDGAMLKHSLVVLSDVVIAETDERKLSMLTGLASNEAYRNAYLPELMRRAQLLIDIHHKVGLIKRPRGGTGKQLSDPRLIFQMPSNSATQSAIGAILAEIERVYPGWPHRRKLAKGLLDALLRFSPRDLETFSFGPGEQPKVILTPVLSILGRSSVQICWWHRTKERIARGPHQVSSPQDVNSEKQWTKLVSDLPEITKGKLMVRLEAVDQNENYKPAVLAWVMTSVFLAYGHDYAPIEVE